jgi:hypothetical protein
MASDFEDVTRVALHGKFLTVDKADLGKIGGFNWSLDKRGFAYVIRNKVKIRLTRLLTDAGEKQKVFASNGDYLDMRRCNLRISTSGSGDMDGYKACSALWEPQTNWRLFIAYNITQHQPVCRSCSIQKTRLRRLALRSRSEVEILQAQQIYASANPTKKCYRCNHTLSISSYGTARNKPSGYNDECRECSNKTRDEHARRNKALLDSEMEILTTPKECSRCHETKDPSQFGFDRTRKYGITSDCVKCRNEVAKLVGDRKRALIAELKIGCSCEECGYDDHKALEFAHYSRDCKARYTTGRPAQPSKLGLERLAAELEFVRLLCRVCHAYETASENEVLRSDSASAERASNRIAHLYDLVNGEKEAIGECCDCGFAVADGNYFAFDFDHRPGERKITNISRMVSNMASEESIMAEMEKCDLRCKNGHVIVTGERRDDYD